MNSRVVLKLDSKYLLNKGVKFDYFEVSVESSYSCGLFCIKNFSGINCFNYDKLLNALVKMLTQHPISRWWIGEQSSDGVTVETACLPASLSVCIIDCVSVCLCVCLHARVSVCLYVPVSACPSVCMPFCMSVCVCVWCCQVAHVNVMTKMDLLSKEARLRIERYLDPDMTSVLADEITDDQQLVPFHKLNLALATLVRH